MLGLYRFGKKEIGRERGPEVGLQQSQRERGKGEGERMVGNRRGHAARRRVPQEFGNERQRELTRM